ncbi:hypothetical protein QL285_031755 [Trifolium repens]|nr:hypothetical protein QL285_031755 [Trifolium repens]
MYLVGNMNNTLRKKGGFGYSKQKPGKKKGKKIGTLVPQPITTKNRYSNQRAINRNKNTKPHTTPEVNSIRTKQLRN